MKEVYKIPESLDSNYFDVEIAIQTNDGMGIKPVPIKIILSVIISVLLCFYFLTHGLVSTSTGLQKFLFVLLWIGLSFVLISYDKSRKMNIQLVPVLLNYAPKKNRHIFTRRSTPANDFFSILGIDSISKNGTIRFLDKSYGNMYHVVGSASILLFEDDKKAIIERVDNFYRKMGLNYEIVFLTVKEPQKIHHQLANLKRNYDNMEVHDPDLEELYEQQFNVLKYLVGDECKSIHQYMLVKGDNKEAQIIANNIIQAEVENSSLLFKKCTVLNYKEIIDVLRPIYKGVEER